VFVQIVDGAECHQGLLDERGAPTEMRPRPLPLSHLRPRLGWAGRLLGAHRRALRVLVRAAYLAPLLLVPKCVLCSWPEPGEGPARASHGDWITVGFVALVLLFFLSVSIYLVLFLAAGPPSRRRRGWGLRPAPTDDRAREPALGAAALQALADSADAEGDGGPLRVRGQTRAFHAQADRPLLCDLWGELAGKVLRVTSGRPFLLENLGQPPVVVPAGVPLLLAPYQRVALGADEESLTLRRLQEAMKLPPAEACMRLTLGEQTWLELEAPRHRRVPSLADLVLEGQGYTPEPGAARDSPYRPGAPQPALLVMASETEPILLRLLDCVTR